MKPLQLNDGLGIALVAHDARKHDLYDWTYQNRGILDRHRLYATQTTGQELHQRLGLRVDCVNSGPAGGDQQIGARIVEGLIDILVFFWDPLGLHPHETDVRALVRIAVLANIPLACNRTTADYLITSPLFETAQSSATAQRVTVLPYGPSDERRGLPGPAVRAS